MVILVANGLASQLGGRPFSVLNLASPLGGKWRSFRSPPIRSRLSAQWNRSGGQSPLLPSIIPLRRVAFEVLLPRSSKFLTPWPTAFARHRYFVVTEEVSRHWISVNATERKLNVPRNDSFKASKLMVDSNVERFLVAPS